jgi:hypothetical protein
VEASTGATAAAEAGVRWAEVEAEAARAVAMRVGGRLVVGEEAAGRQRAALAGLLVAALTAATARLVGAARVAELAAVLRVGREVAAGCRVEEARARAAVARRRR